MRMLIFNFKPLGGIEDVGAGLPSKQGLGTQSHHKVPSVHQFRAWAHTSSEPGHIPAWIPTKWSLRTPKSSSHPMAWVGPSGLISETKEKGLDGPLGPGPFFGDNIHIVPKDIDTIISKVTLLILALVLKTT